jgi:Replication-relaxation
VVEQVADLPVSYVDAHRYDGAVLQHDRRERAVPCAIQQRDFAIVRDVCRYKFLSAPQIGELWWPGRGPWPAQRRLHKLFEAGLLERLRPVARRGSFPWTYHLGELGHRMLREGGALPATARFRPRLIYDFGHVLHELQLNAWVLALRRGAGERFLEWEGERDIEPPRQTREEMRDVIRRVYGDWSVHGMRDERERPVRPDAVLELERRDGDGFNTLLIEFDRTRRVDKNFEKFRRYDTFLSWWWYRMPEALDLDPPYVIFICQDQEHLRAFVHAADYELTGHHWHPSYGPEDYRFIGRERILFCVERDAHAGSFAAWRVPEFPSDHRAREPNVRGVRFLTAG